MKIAKQMIETSIRMRKMTDWTLWRDQPPSKQKKGLHTEQEPEIRIPGHSRSYAPPRGAENKQDDGDNLN